MQLINLIVEEDREQNFKISNSSQLAVVFAACLLLIINKALFAICASLELMDVIAVVNVLNWLIVVGSVLVDFSNSLGDALKFYAVVVNNDWYILIIILIDFYKFQRKYNLSFINFPGSIFKLSPTSVANLLAYCNTAGTLTGPCQL